MICQFADDFFTDLFAAIEAAQSWRGANAAEQADAISADTLGNLAIGYIRVGDLRDAFAMLKAAYHIQGLHDVNLNRGWGKPYSMLKDFLDTINGCYQPEDSDESDNSEDDNEAV